MYCWVSVQSSARFPHLNGEGDDTESAAFSAALPKAITPKETEPATNQSDKRINRQPGKDDGG
jgi:hypothetical protein